VRLMAFPEERAEKWFGGAGIEVTELRQLLKLEGNLDFATLCILGKWLDEGAEIAIVKINWRSGRAIRSIRVFRRGEPALLWIFFEFDTVNELDALALRIVDRWIGGLLDAVERDIEGIVEEELYQVLGPLMSGVSCSVSTCSATIGGETLFNFSVGAEDTWIVGGAELTIYRVESPRAIAEKARSSAAEFKRSLISAIRAMKRLPPKVLVTLLLAEDVAREL